MTGKRKWIVRHRWSAGVLIVVVGMAGAWYYVGSRQAARDRDWAQRRTLQLVGLAALGYFNDLGSPPLSVDALFGAGYLRLERDGFVWMYRSPEVPTGAVPSEYLARVRLAIPGSATEYASRGGAVIDRRSGERLIIVDIAGHCVKAGEFARINDSLAQAWIKIARGEPSGEPWIDRRCSGSPAGSESENSQRR